MKIFGVLNTLARHSSHINNINLIILSKTRMTYLSINLLIIFRSTNIKMYLIYNQISIWKCLNCVNNLNHALKIKKSKNYTFIIIFKLLESILFKWSVFYWNFKNNNPTNHCTAKWQVFMNFSKEKTTTILYSLVYNNQNKKHFPLHYMKKQNTSYL